MDAYFTTSNTNQMKLQYLLVMGVMFFSFTKAQSQQPATAPQQVEQALQQKEQMMQNSIVKNVAFESIGPTIMSGRVVDLDVNPDNPAEFYVGYASGGL